MFAVVDLQQGVVPGGWLEPSSRGDLLLLHSLQFHLVRSSMMMVMMMVSAPSHR
jgi:hypothetical protein